MILYLENDVYSIKGFGKGENISMILFLLRGRRWIYGLKFYFLLIFEEDL